MNIDKLTIGQAKEISSMIMSAPQGATSSLNSMIGQKVIIRTYSAGVWFGLLSEKESDEIILKDARRMWSWKAKESISLSACALFGIDENESKIVSAVENIWLQAIEIIPCTDQAIKSIEKAAYVTAG